MAIANTPVKRKCTVLFTAMANAPGSFGVSAYLDWLHSPAPREEVRSEVAKVLAILGEHDPALAEAVTQEPFTQGVLATLKYRSAWLAPNTRRDRIGCAAALYWAVQLLASTVLRSSVLNVDATYSLGVERAIRRGADGLFEFGETQFEELGAFALEIIDWVIEHKPGSVCLIESPIGNTLPVQVLQDCARQRASNQRRGERSKMPRATGRLQYGGLISSFSSMKSFLARVIENYCGLFRRQSP